MTYLIEKENGNGYTCGCCRRTNVYTDTMEFDSDEDAKAYVERYNANYDRSSDDHDSRITACYPLSGGSLI